MINNQWVKETTIGKMRRYFDSTKMKDEQNSWDLATEKTNKKFIALNICIKKRKPKINNQICHFKAKNVKRNKR